MDWRGECIDQVKVGLDDVVVVADADVDVEEEDAGSDVLGRTDLAIKS